MIEEWKDISGYEGLYQVSSFGNVKRVRHSTVQSNGVTRNMQEKPIKPFVRNPTGKYKSYCVNLIKNKKFKTHCIARLVADAFIPNPEGKYCVNHIDGHTYNNHISNLEWATHSENAIHAHRVLKNAPNRAAKVQNIDTGQVFNTIKEANVFYGKSEKCSNIVAVCRGKRKIAHGHRWQYV